MLVSHRGMQSLRSAVVESPAEPKVVKESVAAVMACVRQSTDEEPLDGDALTLRWTRVPARGPAPEQPFPPARRARGRRGRGGGQRRSRHLRRRQGRPPLGAQQEKKETGFRRASVGAAMARRWRRHRTRRCAGKRAAGGESAEKRKGERNVTGRGPVAGPGRAPARATGATAAGLEWEGRRRNELGFGGGGRLGFD